MWLVRTDADGDTIWTKLYGGTGRQVGNSLCIMPDGGFLISGGNYLLHTDNNGDTIWTNTLTGNVLIVPIIDDRSFIHQTSDGGYIVVGTVFSNTTTFRDLIIIRFDSVWDDVDVVHEFNNVRPAFNKFKSVAGGDWNGYGISEIAVIQGCELKVYDPVTKKLHLVGDFNQDGDVDGSDFLICDNGELTEGVEVHLMGFVNFKGTQYAVVNASAVDGSDFLIWQRGIIINTQTNKVVYNSEEAKFIAILKLPNGKSVILSYIEQDNLFKIIGEPAGNPANSYSRYKLLSYMNQSSYQLQLKFQSDPGLQLAYDPDLFDPPGDIDLDDDGYPDISILKIEGMQPSGMIVRAGDNFDIIWDFTFPDEHKDKILKGFHGFADVDGNGVKEAIFGDNLVVTLDGTVHTIDENFVTLDVNDLDNDGFEDIIGINTVDSSIVVYGFKTSTTAANTNDAEIHFQLFQNYPNPFNPNTTISYSVSKTEEVDLTIFNSLGQVIRRLINETKPAGEYTLTWNGRNDAGQLVSSGPYFYRLKIGEAVQTRRMLLIK